MSLAELQEALAAEDDQLARKAVRACGVRLRDGTIEERNPIVYALAPLARHPSATVRQAVADVCDAFPDFDFEDTHAVLAADAHHYVVAAAEAAAHRRAQRRRGQTKADAQEQVLAGLLSELETVYGRDARRLAERAVQRGVEHFVGRMEHEVSKAESPVSLTLAQLATDARSPSSGPQALLAHIATLRERVEFVFSVIRRAREYSTGLKATFAEQSLHDLVNEACGQLTARLGVRAARVDLRIDVDAAIRFEADRFAILQALQNVLQNAAEACVPSAERVVIRIAGRLSRSGAELELRISDDGIGMTEEEQAAMFVPFGSRKPGGTGVGMLIVRKMVVDVHGGELRIEGARGAGTTVTLVLPVKQGTRRLTAPSAPVRTGRRKKE